MSVGAADVVIQHEASAFDTSGTDFDPDREAKWDAYEAGLKAALEESDGEGFRYGQIFDGGGAFDPDDWTEFRGVAQWDHEDYFMNFQGAVAGHMAFDPTGIMLDWEYNAACRYVWERTHRWFTEVFAPDVEALIFYHHPWQPNKSQGLMEGWAGHPEQDDLAWLYKMQGAFDGHCYPPHALGYPHPDEPEEADDIHDWVRNVLENFEGMQDTGGHAEGLFCYVTLWPSRPGGETFHSPESLTQMIDSIADMWDGGWTDFNVCMMGLPGLGGADRDKYPIHGYPTTTKVRIILNGDPGPALTKRFQFDPRFETFKIEGTIGGNNNRQFWWDFDANGYPDVVDIDDDWFCDLKIVGDSFNQSAQGGHVIRRAKTWTNFVDWWGSDDTDNDPYPSFLYILEQQLGD